MTIACLVTTYARPEALARSLPQIAALGAPVLVVDDGSTNIQSCFYDIRCAAVDYLRLPWNRGLACALNVGLSYLLADKSITHISYFQDDTDVHPDCHELLWRLKGKAPLLSGHDAGEHKAIRNGNENGIEYLVKDNIRATHMFASRDFWQSIMPIPTRELGAPKRTKPGERGHGSNVDWHITQWADNSPKKKNQPIIVVPGLVRSFLWQGEDSCWNNTSKAGEEPPLRA